MTNLEKLHQLHQQSPWLDNLSRNLINSGRLQQYINSGIRGLTSNPTILEKAITESSDYDQDIREYIARGLNNEEIFFKLSIADIQAASKAFLPLYESSNKEDGYVSLEVSPNLADDTEGTIKQAKALWQEVGVQNLFIKVPATPAGIPAIRELLSAGINVNVTLLFGLDRYQEVITAFKDTHMTGSGNQARSVASLFVSRVDNEIDKTLNSIATPQALELRGKTAVAQTIMAYDVFLERLGKEAVIDAHGPSVQRLLLASTSTKNPEYSDLLYVANLLLPLTVNTLPEKTIEAILDHLPQKTQTVSMVDIDQAYKTIQSVKNLGIDLSDVSNKLETEGVNKFKASFDSLLTAIESKRDNS